MQLLKQSTAWTAIVGPILDSAGAEYTGAVIGDLSISKNGTEAAMATAATLTHVSNGFYTLVGTTGNSDTLGALTIRCNKSTYQMPPKEYTVFAAAPFDTLITNGTLASMTSGRTLDVTATGGAGIDWSNVEAPTTTLNLSGTTVGTAAAVTTVNGLAANVITAASAATDFGAEIQALITGGAYTLATDANGRIRIVDGTGTGEINTNAGAIALVDLVTDITTKTGFRLSATGVDDIWDEAMDASLLTARQTLLLASSNGLGLFSVNDASATTTSFVTNLSSGVDNFYRDMQLKFFSGTLTGQTRVIASYVGSTKTVTLDEALTGAPANGVAFVIGPVHTHTVSSIADAIWEEILADHSGTAGSTAASIANIQARLPTSLVGGRIDATVDGTGMESGAINALIEACFTYDATATYASADAGSLVKQIADNAGGSALTATAIADEVQTRTIAGVTLVATTTNLTNLPTIPANWLTAAGTAADFGAEIQALITGGAYAVSTDANGRVRIVDGTGAGEIDTSSGAVAHVVLADTTTTLTNAPSDSSGTTTLLSRLSSTRAGYLDNLSAGAVATAASIAALNNLSASAVNAEVVDALATDTYAEPSQGAPGATISLAAKLNWLYTSWRNRKTNDGTDTKLYADNGTTVLSKQLTSESGGTVEKAEWITGA